MFEKIMIFAFVFVTLEGLNYFLLKKWREKNHRSWSLTKVTVVVAWIGLLCGVINSILSTM